MARPINVTVLGAGSWGTTVASLAARNTPTLLWARDPDTVTDINDNRRNSRYLGDVELDGSLRATSDLGAAVQSADVVVMGVPSGAVRNTLDAIAGDLRAWVPIISLAKGLEPGTRMRPTQVIADALPGHPVALLAGPNIASEVARGYAAAAVVATDDDNIAAALHPLFTSGVFRVYRNDDVLGCELGGVLKNVIAIASGMADGLGVGDNTRAMVLTRGLAEITRLGVAMGAQPSTFAGLTGVGDLIATCTSPRSRNRRFGELIAAGKSIAEAQEILGQVAEGVRTTPIVMELAEEHGIELPICTEVASVLAGRSRPTDAYRGLQRILPDGGHEVS